MRIPVEKGIHEEFREKLELALEVIYPPRTNYMQSKLNDFLGAGRNREFSAPIILWKRQKMEQLNSERIPKDNTNWNGMPEQQQNLYAIDGKIYGTAGFEWNSF